MADDDVLELHVTTAPVGTNSLMLRMSPELADGVRAQLDESGLEHSTALEHSAGPELVLEIVEILNAVGGASVALTAALQTYLRRHDGKKVAITGGAIEATGYSIDDVGRLVEMQTKRQEAEEAKWKKEIEDD